MGQLGGPQVRWPQQLMGGFPDGVHEVVSQVLTLWMVSKSPGCWSPSYSLSLPLPQVMLHTLVFWER